uniref:Inositol-tetrakisphosphate 1-kinase n=1 Tax=Oryza nivara TaxID=4536 RepID=A0A0E0GT54_ORYNI
MLEVHSVLSQLSSTTLSSELSPEAPSGGGRRRQRRAAHGALPSSVHNGGAGQIERRRCWADVAAALGEAARSGSSSSVATRARPERQLGSQIQVGLAGSSRGRRRRAPYHGDGGLGGSSARRRRRQREGGRCHSLHNAVSQPHASFSFAQEPVATSFWWARK